MALSLSLALSLPLAAPAQALPTLPTRDFDIFVDPPTGFVFLKLPAGWKFVGKLNELELKSLPANVLTSLLATDPVDRLASPGTQFDGFGKALNCRAGDALGQTAAHLA